MVSFNLFILQLQNKKKKSLWRLNKEPDSVASWTRIQVSSLVPAFMNSSLDRMGKPRQTLVPGEKVDAGELSTHRVKVAFEEKMPQSQKFEN